MRSMFILLTSIGILPTACAASMEEDLLASAQLTNFFDRLHDADLVVDGHNTDKRRLRSDRCLQLLHIDETILLHRQIGDLESLILQVPTRIQHTLVLCLAGDDVIFLAALLEEACDALDAHVVAFGCATREDDLFWIGTNQIGDVLACLLDRLVCLPPVCVCS